MKNAINDWKFVLLLCLTFGLAPYYPVPHIMSKLRWLASGGRGMEWFDLADLAVHSLPWLLLLRLLLRKHRT